MSIENNIDELKAKLHDTLYLDLDEFGLELDDGEVTSKFVGLNLHSAFQPIHNLRDADNPLGYEALLRPSIGQTDAVTPAFAFSFADSQGKLVKFDRVARTLHTLNYLGLPANRGLLFLNVHPKLLVSINAHGKVFERVLHDHSVPTHQVVIEIVESAIEVEKKLQEAVENYRDRGYRVAIDDFGSNHSNLDRLWDISPDYIKLDGRIISEAQHNPKVRRILPKLIEVVHGLEAEAVIEGIENSIQYQIALDSGANFLQGYHLGRPERVSFWQANQIKQRAAA